MDLLTQRRPKLFRDRDRSLKYLDKCTESSSIFTYMPFHSFLPLSLPNSTLPPPSLSFPTPSLYPTHPYLPVPYAPSFPSFPQFYPLSDILEKGQSTGSCDPQSILQLRSGHCQLLNTYKARITTPHSVE